MAVARQSAGLTYEDYTRLPDDGKRYEIIEGELYVAPAPTPEHQRDVGRLHLLLQPEAQKVGAEVFLSPIDVILGEDKVVQPDLLVLTADQRQLVSERGIDGAPALVVEVLSPSTSARDRGVKRKMYADAGVREYWLVSREAGTIEILALREGRYEVHRRAGYDEPVASTVLPGLAFPASAAFNW